MTNKTIDILLLIGLVLVGFMIMWTLFTLEPASPPTVTSQSNTNEVSVAPNEMSAAPEEPITTQTETPAETITAVTPDTIQDATPPEEARAPESELQQATPTALDSDQASADTLAVEEEAEEAAANLDAALPLERVGFSFVTGGPGACGVVLEAWQHIAVSRDILADYGCGTEVSLVLEDETAGRRQIRAIIADTMNPVHTRTANIYVGSDEPALSYGVTAGRLELTNP